jgi:hypothetical protein
MSVDQNNDETQTSKTVQESLWDRHEGNDEVHPQYCPHCGEKLAHPDNLMDNDDLRAVSRTAAYRQHRQAHFEWGTDPADVFGGDDPYLANHYDGVEDSAGVTQDPEEEVAGVYDVEINYDAVLRARVVAADKHQAKDRAEDLALSNEECVGGYVPSKEVTHQVHDRVREVQSLTRGEIEESSDVDEEEDSGINWAYRLLGWPW